tara:strand:- start:371 stop:1813 length:1443 start_codon:yes stop_codon:yes gene_type:complete
VTQQPNIILIVTDQQRGDCIGHDPHAPEALQTPNLDWLARSGSHFLHAYAECPSCIPARRSLMSGMAPAATGLVGFQVADWNPTHTLAGELSKAGYQTEMIGKAHLFPPRRRYGFDHMQLADATRGSENDYVHWLCSHHGKTEIDPGMAHGISANGWVGRPHHLPEEQMHSFWVVDRALEFLKKRDPTAPFFLNLSFIDPHPPLTPPAFYYQRYVDRELPPPIVGDWAVKFDGPQTGLNPNAAQICLDKQQMQCTRAAYYGMINFVDDQIGRLIQFADQLDDCFVIFTSDHGEMLGDHNLFRKTWPYEASSRVPFIARAPKTWQFPYGNTPSSPVGLQDVMPTILDVAGLDIPEKCTGHSLLPMIKGKQTSVRELLHGEHAGCYDYEDGNQFLTDGNFKYVWFTQTGREQLFDLKNDPQEKHDLALQQGANEQLDPWRKQLIHFLLNRPEGFTDGKQLIPKRPHKHLIPGYNPDCTYPFL